MLNLLAKAELLPVKINTAEGGITVAALYMPFPARWWKRDENKWHGRTNIAEHQNITT